MKRLITSFLSLAVILLIYACSDPVSKELDAFPQVSEKSSAGWFPLSGSAICYDPSDFKVVGITAGMLSDDIGRVTGSRAEVQAQTALPKGPAVLQGNRCTFPGGLAGIAPGQSAVFYAADSGEILAGGVIA